MGRFNRRGNKQTTQPDNSTKCTMQQGYPLYHKKREFRSVEKQGTWHAHFYSKPPAHPTPHFIVDILGLESRRSSLHINKDEETTKKKGKQQDFTDNTITDIRKQRNNKGKSKTKIYHESCNRDNKVDSTKAKTPGLPKQITKREHCEGSSGKTDDEPEDVKRKKKARTTFTGRQIWELENTFKDKKYLTANERNDLARLLNVTDNQVKIWFQNRRTKWKKYCMCTSVEKSAAKNFANGYEDSPKLKENGGKYMQRTTETDYDSISDNSCD